MGLTDYLLDFDFSYLLFYTNTELLWSSLKRIIEDAVSQFTPRPKSRRGRFPRWFTPLVRHHLNQIQSLRKKARKSPSSLPCNCTKLSNAEHLLQDEMQSVKAGYEFNLVHDLSSSKNYNIYKYICHLHQYKSIPSQLHFNSTQAVTDAEKANLLNNYFSSILTCSSFYLPSPSTIPVPQEILSNIDISVSDVYTALASIDNTKAMGIDKTHPRILKMSATALCKPIHHLFTLCLSQSYLPFDRRTYSYHSNPSR